MGLTEPETPAAPPAAPVRAPPPAAVRAPPPAGVSAPPPNAPVIQKTAPVAAGQSVLKLLEERIANYERAEAQATIDNESARARR